MTKYPQSGIVRGLLTKGQPITVSKGEMIIGNRPEPTGLHYISTGYVKEYSISNSGDEYMHLIYGSGELFPLVWAYLGVHSEDLFYEAISDCVLWRISREWFNTFIQSNLEVCYAMSIQLAQQYRVFNDRVDNLQYKKASERVAYRILFLASRFGYKQGSEVVIEPPITHEIFANSINLARESVSREFERLEQQHILQRKNHHIVICDIAALAGMLSRPVDLNSWHL